MPAHSKCISRIQFYNYQYYHFKNLPQNYKDVATQFSDVYLVGLKIFICQ